MSVVELPVRVVAMEALLERGLSYRLVAELFSVATESLLTWARRHRSGQQTLDSLRAQIDPSVDLTRMRSLYEKCGRKDRRGKRPPVSPHVVEIDLRGTVDALSAKTMTTSLIADIEGYEIAEGDVSFVLPTEVVKKLHIDDKVHIRISVERPVDAAKR